ncbi:MAG: DUF3995 domain-containing protein [Candidatus Eremiobacteraeota bacterium]|nr:DUF3995 domain-containing protein [Candidatus Eremiobacteraeota bacterium]MCW5867362.1 DUF3995 domain-containing protein [Candidatus Eremiobacteraeota bacterium]
MKTTVVWTALLLISALHFYWAAGGRWPGKDHRELSAKVIGDRPLPGPVACLAAAVLLLLGPALFPRMAAVLFCLRGALGMVEDHFRPTIRGTHQSLSKRIYSPLSFLIGLLLWP